MLCSLIKFSLLILEGRNANLWRPKIGRLSFFLPTPPEFQTKSVLFFTKYSIFIVDVKSGRFMYQSGRAEDEAKKLKSPAKSGRVGIYVKDGGQPGEFVLKGLKQE